MTQMLFIGKLNQEIVGGFEKLFGQPPPEDNKWANKK